MQQRFYMMCLRETVGTNASFHRKDGHGYSSDINAAHVYTLSEAQTAWETGRSIDLPVSADCVDALTVWHVDHQLIPHATVEEEGCDQYVAFLKGEWDGNDVYWLAGTERPTTDFSKAYIHPFPVTSSEGVVWLPYHQVAAVKRRTFNISLLDRRKMIQAPGLRMPKWLKLQNRRRKNSSGKVRWNCPSCGRISWQHNPYDFDGCSNVDCRGLDG
ncbi:hypothetical protein ACEWL9_003796 [Enterobacter hormaechei]